MAEQFEVRWEGELPGTPQEVWDAVTVHTAGWIWKIEYEPWVGGTERGLTAVGGTVTGWDPPRHFTTRAEDGDGVNQLDYVLEPRGAATCLRFVHRGVIAGDHDRELDACRQHTALYVHTMGEYLRRFAGREPAHVVVEAPKASARGGLAAVRRELGVPEDVAVGDVVRLAPAGLEPIDGVVDYVTPAFLGVRSTDALYRFLGRDVWGWPVGASLHVFSGDLDTATAEKAWSTWLDGVFTSAADEGKVG